jgi:hypothetical protein
LLWHNTQTDTYDTETGEVTVEYVTWTDGQPPSVWTQQHSADYIATEVEYHPQAISHAGLVNIGSQVLDFGGDIVSNFGHVILDLREDLNYYTVNPLGTFASAADTFFTYYSESFHARLRDEVLETEVFETLAEVLLIIARTAGGTVSTI